MADTDGTGANAIAEEEKKETREIRMTVSSKHLTLSSRVFAAMLANNFREGRTLNATGSATISLPEDKVVPFIILMNIIHAKNRKVPKKVTVPLLASLAIIVDKYEFHDSVAPFADSWVKDLEKDIPESVSRYTFYWMAIAWVFEQPKEFYEIGYVLEQEAVGLNFQYKYGEEFFNGLPIPKKAIGKLCLAEDANGTWLTPE